MYLTPMKEGVELWR